MKITKKFLPLALFSLIFTFCGCSKNNTYYYVALRHQNEGKNTEAKRYFHKAIKTGSPYVVRLSMESLTEIGNVKERVEACSNLVEKFKDEDSMLLAAKIYVSAGEYARTIMLTNGLDYANCKNSLAYLRLESMRNKNDSRFYRELYTWFTVRPFLQEQYNLYCTIAKESPDFVESGIEEFKAVADFRAEVFKRNYKNAFETYSASGGKLPLLPQLVSDMGKVCLYGSDSFYKNALAFDDFAKKLSARDSEFYAQFYAGRLYEKAGNYYSYAANRYKAAMKCAETDKLYDNALWYLLNLELKRSTERGINCAKQYCSTWHDAEYFEDFFDTLTPLMLSEGKWNHFYDLYKTLDGYATDEVTARFAYIYGRLLQEKLAMPVITDTHGSEAEAAFTRALLSGSEMYYRVMAISKLGLGDLRAEEILCSNRNKEEPQVDIEAQEILLSFAQFGLPEKIYPMWLRFNSEGKNIGYEAGIKIAGFLKDCGDVRNVFYPQSLRIASKVISKSSHSIQKKDLELLYPRDYSEIISSKCASYEIPEEIFYALVRSESFFDASIGSSAGATGLSQLMNSTAADIAHRLKYGQYDLKNPSDNLEFGAWYIANLYGRLDNLWIPTFFAYNAGITPVRRWKKSSKIEFDNIKSLPDDLFLETIPYSETRQYGRKLVSASAMYAWLYYEKEVMDEIAILVK